jgi:hypothetical protein
LKAIRRLSNLRDIIIYVRGAQRAKTASKSVDVCIIIFHYDFYSLF